jgi:hypothetical protein
MPVAAPPPTRRVTHWDIPLCQSWFQGRTRRSVAAEIRQTQSMEYHWAHNEINVCGFILQDLFGRETLQENRVQWSQLPTAYPALAELVNPVIASCSIKGLEEISNLRDGYQLCTLVKDYLNLIVNICLLPIREQWGKGRGWTDDGANILGCLYWPDIYINHYKVLRDNGVEGSLSYMQVVEPEGPDGNDRTQLTRRNSFLDVPFGDMVQYPGRPPNGVTFGLEGPSLSQPGVSNVYVVSDRIQACREMRGEYLRNWMHDHPKDTFRQVGNDSVYQYIRHFRANLSSCLRDWYSPLIDM